METEIRMMTPRQLAARWGVSTATLHGMRKDGSGPAFFKVGYMVRYRLGDIEAYEDAKTGLVEARSLSERKGAKV